MQVVLHHQSTLIVHPLTDHLLKKEKHNHKKTTQTKTLTTSPPAATPKTKPPNKQTKFNSIGHSVDASETLLVSLYCETGLFISLYRFLLTGLLERKFNPMTA